MSTPQSVVHICSGVRLNSRYEHSIHFASASAQASYFAGKVVKTYTAYTFLRKSWPLKVEATMEQAKAWSYLYFQNGGTGKVYYYFINQIEYINDHTVELTLELDVLQTYMFDYTLLPSFVERQHVEDDTVGKHTQEEGLDPGEYNSALLSDASAMKEMCILVLSSIILNGTSKETTLNAYGNVYGNVFSGLAVTAVEMSDWPKFSKQLDNLSEWGKIDGIVSMWMYPKALVTLAGESVWGDGILSKQVGGTKALTVSVNRPASMAFEGYTPRNNKVYTYPYNFLYVTNNAGSSAAYRFERFVQSNPMQFLVRGALAPDAGTMLSPAGYTPATTGDGLMMSSYPSCAWDSDTYKIWLAQNQNQQDLTVTQGQLKVAVGGVTALSSLAAGNVGGAAGGLLSAYSGYTDIQQLLAAREDKAVEPPQARGAFSASINLANSLHNFAFYRKFCTAEYARRIDDYFTLYGYKVNAVQTPNRKARKAYTYIKTVGCHIAANLCNEDTVKIESIYDHGITWWVNGDSIGDYSQDNATL